MVFPCKIFKGFRVGEVFMFHYEVDRIPNLPATEAFEYLLRWRYRERRCLLIMERTQSQIVNPTFLQRNKLLNNINDLGSIEYSFYSRTVNHDSKIGDFQLSLLKFSVRISTPFVAGSIIISIFLRTGALTSFGSISQSEA